MAFFNWFRNHPVVSALGAIFAFLLFLLQRWSDVQEAQKMVNLISLNLNSIVEFSLSPYFAWIVAIISISCASGLVFWAAKRDEARENAIATAEKERWEESDKKAHDLYDAQLRPLHDKLRALFSIVPLVERKSALLALIDNISNFERTVQQVVVKFDAKDVTEDSDYYNMGGKGWSIRENLKGIDGIIEYAKPTIGDSIARSISSDKPTDTSKIRTTYLDLLEGSILEEDYKFCMTKIAKAQELMEGEIKQLDREMAEAKTIMAKD